MNNKVSNEKFYIYTSGTDMFKLFIGKIFGKRSYEKMKDPNNQLTYCRNYCTAISSTQLLKYSLRKAILKLVCCKYFNLQDGIFLEVQKQDEHEREKQKQLKEEKRQNRIKAMLDKIAQKDAICIFAPLPTPADLKDGYCARIEAIDKCALNDYVRIYLWGENKGLEKIDVTIKTVDRMVVNFDSWNPEHREFVFNVIKQCGRTYTHSIVRFLPNVLAEEMLQVFFFKNCFNIWDVHGSTPEEFILYKDNIKSYLAGAIEHLVYNNANLIISVTKTMELHLQKKYGATEAPCIVLPIFSKELEENKSRMWKEVSCCTKPTIVYAGGTQKWQKVDLMKKVIKRTLEFYKYIVLVTNTKEFVIDGIEENNSANIIISSRPPEEVKQIYSHCQYGIAFRDDIVVNNVACPTKIIEYIEHGIVPVFNTDKVGDFVAMGLKYVMIDDLLNNNLPNEQQRLDMVKNNYDVLARLLEIGEKGKNELKQALAIRRK